jgi:hypothetical protein
MIGVTLILPSWHVKETCIHGKAAVRRVGANMPVIALTLGPSLLALVIAIAWTLSDWLNRGTGPVGLALVLLSLLLGTTLRSLGSAQQWPWIQSLPLTRWQYRLAMLLSLLPWLAPPLLAIQMTGAWGDTEASLRAGLTCVAMTGIVATAALDPLPKILCALAAASGVVWGWLPGMGAGAVVGLLLLVHHPRPQISRSAERWRTWPMPWPILIGTAVVEAAGAGVVRGVMAGLCATMGILWIPTLEPRSQILGLVLLAGLVAGFAGGSIYALGRWRRDHGPWLQALPISEQRWSLLAMTLPMTVILAGVLPSAVLVAPSNPTAVSLTVAIITGMTVVHLLILRAYENGAVIALLLWMPVATVTAKVLS